MSHRRSAGHNGSIVVFGVILVVEMVIVILLQTGLLSTLLSRSLHYFSPILVPAVALEHLGPIGTSTIPRTVSLEDAPLDTTKQRYLEVVESCNDIYAGSCVRARSGPGKEFPVVSKLRTGMVLKVASSTTDATGVLWHKVMFDEWLRYPERVTEDWYVAADVVEEYYEEGKTEVAMGFATGTKKIVVDRSEQQLYAYDGEILFLKATTSTGLELTPTPRGIFHIFRKIPTRYMQGPLPYLADTQVYDLPGVPWTLYFTAQGAAIHGAYWHNEFGNRHSHGCVNLPPKEAKTIYDWVQLGTTVVVQD